MLGQLGPGFNRTATRSAGRPATGPVSLGPWVGTPSGTGATGADGGPAGWTGRRSLWCRTPRNMVTLAEWRGGQYNKFL